MKKKRKNHIHMIILALFFVLVFVGCTGASGEPTSVQQSKSAESKNIEDVSEEQDIPTESMNAEEVVPEELSEEVSELASEEVSEEPTTEEATEQVETFSEEENIVVEEQPLQAETATEEPQNQTAEPQPPQTETPAESVETPSVETPPPTPQTSYVLNTNTKKFHIVSCGSVNKIKESNRYDYTGTREEVISMGYSPCGNCHP